MYKCRTGEVVETYKQYLKTRHWKSIKQAVFESRVYECTKCGVGKNLHIHHLTYDRVGKERLSDLIYLCETCHSEVHSKYKLDKVITKKQYIKRKKSKKTKKKVKIKRKPTYKPPKRKFDFKPLDDLEKYKA